jgi:hypothetical protein
VGAVRSIVIVFALITWFGSLATLVVLLVQLRRSLRANQGQVGARPRVRTIDRIRAAARWRGRGPETIDRMPGISRQETAYRPGPPYPQAQRNSRLPEDTSWRLRRPDANDPQRRFPDWSDDPERKLHTLQSATVVRPRVDGRTPPGRGRRDEPPPPRSRRDR